MAGFDSTASTVPTAAKSSRRRWQLGRHGTSARVPPRPASLQDLWDGASWERRHDWLRRVASDIGVLAPATRRPPGAQVTPRPIGVLTGGRAT
jgi:hypothetical protein